MDDDGWQINTDGKSDVFLERPLELRAVPMDFSNGIICLCTSRWVKLNKETNSHERPSTASSKTTKTLPTVNSHARRLGSHVIYCVENYMNVYCC